MRPFRWADIPKSGTRKPRACPPVSHPASDRIPLEETTATNPADSWMREHGVDPSDEDAYNALNYFGDPEPRCRRCGGRIPREFRDSEAFCERCIRDPRVRESVKNFASLNNGIVN